MILKKTIFIIPGFRHLPTDKAYKSIARLLESEGYHPILVTIPWKKSTILENTKYFLQEYKKIKAKKKYILGFSFGAMIAFLASTKVSSSGLILCSLSPFFQEDNTRIQLEDKEFFQLHCATLAKKLKAKQILLLYGTKEAKSLIKRVNDAFDSISSKEKYLIPVDKTEHDIGDKRYLQIIKLAAKALN